MAPETFIVGPDAQTRDEIRAELIDQSRQKAQTAYEAGDLDTGFIWLRVGEWLARTEVRP